MDDTEPLIKSSSHEPEPNNGYQVFHLRGDRVIKIKKTSWNIVLTILTVVTNLAMNVVLPLYSNSMTKEGHSEYPVLLLSAVWFPVFFFSIVAVAKFLNPMMSIISTVSHRMMALVGLLNALNGIFVVYASSTVRTSATLQAILSTSIIPFTVICRYIILRKGVSRARLVCTIIVLIGLFISLEPTIFNINGTNESSHQRSDLSPFEQVLWPIIFMFGFLPLGIMNAVLEKELKKEETESLLFLAWVQF